MGKGVINFANLDIEIPLQHRDKGPETETGRWENTALKEKMETWGWSSLRFRLLFLVKSTEKILPSVTDDEVDDPGTWPAILKSWDKGLVHLNSKFKTHTIERYWDAIFDLFFFHRQTSQTRLNDRGLIYFLNLQNPLQF